MDSAHEMKVHEKTYGGFVNLLKWVVPITAILTFIVVLLIA